MADTVVFIPAWNEERVEEVAVHMRERAHGESKLQGRTAVKLVLTVTATLLFFRWLKRRGG